MPPRSWAPFMGPSLHRAAGDARGCLASGRSGRREACGDAGRHRPGDLGLAHDDLIGTELAEIVDLGLRMGPCENGERMIGGPRFLDEAAALERIRDGAD